MSRLTLRTVRNYFRRSFNRPFSKINISWLKEKYIKHLKPGKNYSFMLFNKHKMHFNDPPLFLFALQQIFIEEHYRYENKSERPYIIDCGGNIGVSALYFHINYPGAVIDVYEPDTHNYEIARKNIEEMQNPNIRLFKNAVWINNDMLSFSEQNNMSSAIIKDTTPAAQDAKVTQVQAVRLKEVIDKKVDLLKIDIEGAEYEVLKDIADKLHFVDNIFIEYHGDYANISHLTEMLNIITDAKYKWYIREEARIFPRPLFDKKRDKGYDFDMQLNIYAFR